MIGWFGLIKDKVQNDGLESVKFVIKSHQKWTTGYFLETKNIYFYDIKESFPLALIFCHNTCSCIEN